MPAAAISLPKDQRRFEARGIVVTVLLPSPATRGRYCAFDYLAQAGAPGPAIHLHQRTEETFHVLDGQMTFFVNDKLTVATAGTVVHVPAGVQHAFWNAGPGPSRMIITMSPGGFEQYFEGLFALVRSSADSGMDIRPLVAQLGERYDQIVIGPSPAAAGVEHSR
jgi:mannose-6-phosphate isomerase-like protein (cupin superfamily)